LDTEKAGLIEQPSSAAVIPPATAASRKLRDIAAQKKVSVDFNEAQLSKIIEYLSNVSGINIVMDESAVSRSGSLSIHMKDITLVQALESVLRTKGLAYRFEENSIWVSTREGITNEELVTRIYHLSQGLATFYHLLPLLIP
jgi:Secretin and TonB N terminus short domain.